MFLVIKIIGFRACVEKGELPKIELLEDNISSKFWKEKEDYYIAKYDNLTNQEKVDVELL